MKGTFPPLGIAFTAATLWTAGARLRASLYEAGLLRQRRLEAGVISIGNISWGGTGKTPLTIWLAGRLQAEGLGVSILTRGYGRTSPEKVKLHPPGAAAEAAREDGDEVQLYLRHLRLSIGISASRYAAGKLVEANFPVDVHLLDDGFQHLALARDMDIVLVDATRGQPAPLPLREGFSSLRRAHAVLLTRCELAEETAGSQSRLENLQESVRRVNPDALCFLVRTKLLHFADYRGGGRLPVEAMSARRPLAFCGVGNPDNFFRTLARAGIEPVGKKFFRDHHRYSENDLQLLAKLAQENQADCCVTTEKDIVNLPPAAELSLPLYWAAIEPVVENEDRLIGWILERLRLGRIKQPHLAGAGQAQCRAASEK